jgi:hypothetical protein
VALGDSVNRRGKAGQWKAWYDRAIRQAEELYEVYLRERAREKEERR